MRLEKLQVSGFKSFVDPTDIRLPANLVAVVGPNGCGKSNIIDAVRWVMGETSAKMLRGDNMADVIFNGSAARKPVGKASVELLFDNSDGTAGGSFTRFAEISVKRTLSRDGHSSYFINRIKTRRKDVLDLFRGTGLGPRSYSIIEQGMVSRIVEARPEDLRLFVEEAAGTSKYKDRRRETETRIGHTRENLERVADIRDELDKQLRRLKRQAGSAKRYKTLKEEQRLVNGQLLVLRLRDMDGKLAEQERVSARCENDLEAALAAQRETEAETEKLRRAQSDSREKHNQVQQEYYTLGAEIKNIEQRVDHLGETRKRRGEEIERLQTGREERERQLEDDQSQLRRLQEEQAALGPETEKLEGRRREAEAQLAEAERALENWQGEWEAFNEQSQGLARQREVQQSRITQLEQHLKRSGEQTARLQQELADARKLIEAMDIEAVRADVKRHDDACAQSEQEFQQTEASIQSLEQAARQKREASAQLRARRHETQSRLDSLRQIQAAALGGDDEALQKWLKESGLGDRPKLAARIRVADGWQRAADRLLNGYLGALCIEQWPAGPDDSNDLFGARPDCAFILVADTPKSAAAADESSDSDDSGRARLLDKVDAGATDLSGFLGGVYVAESLTEAVAMQPGLGNRECAVTRDGALVGANWVSFASQSQLETGVLVREEEINQLQHDLGELESEVAAGDREIAQLESRREAERKQGRQQRETLEELRGGRTEMHATLGREEARHLEIQQRIAALDTELGSLDGHAHTDHGEINKARELQQQAADRHDALEAKRDELLKAKAGHQNTVTERKDELRQTGEQVHRQALHKQRLDAECQSTADGIARLEAQLRGAAEQLAQINDALDETGDPVAALKAKLQDMLGSKVEIEGRLSETGDAVAALDERITRINERQSFRVDAVGAARETLEQHKLARQEILVRRDTQAEQIANEGYDRQLLDAEMPAKVGVEEWQRRVEELEHKVNRIGPVNLVAIEEFDEESERKEYLDQQYADLTEALDTLRSVIRKIDRETRTRFKDTFDRLNAGFNEFFPRLFGGGKAELQLTDDDFLTAGVIVMAHPPGKRNSHIHLLSGGEKALTAVALLFALFKLNPAPFCMLDEVDAPLDDANVERYCDTLKTLVQASQMIVITHNKITMEAAEVLVGVTMGEPGVSRLVSVDVDQAVEMAAQ